jgi:hypothetical protein
LAVRRRTKSASGLTPANDFGGEIAGTWHILLCTLDSRNNPDLITIILTP